MLLWLLAACKPSVPRQFIQPDDMEDLLYDYHVGQAMAQLAADSKDRAFDESLYFAAALEKHGVTQAEFDSSMVYYYTRADRFEEIYKRVTQRLSDNAVKLGAAEGEVNRYNQLNATGDTANVWEGNSTLVLMPYAPYNRLDFSQKADSSYHKGDTFMMYFSTDFSFQSGSREAVVCLAITYDNDSVVSRVNHITVNGISQIYAPVVEDHCAKELKGFIYLGPGSEKSSTFKMMYIHHLQLIRFHKANTDSTKAERPEIKLAADTLVRKESSADTTASPGSTISGTSGSTTDNAKGSTTSGTFSGSGDSALKKRPNRLQPVRLGTTNKP